MKDDFVHSPLDRFRNSGTVRTGIRFSAELLWAVLEDNVPPGTTGLLVAVSGGRDSSCLLAALAHPRQPARVVEAAGEGEAEGEGEAAGEGVVEAAAAGADAGLARALPLRAVHVDHGLQAASVAMREASAALCRRFDVPLEVVRLEVAVEAGVSLEAAARAARYRAFAGVMQPGECLLTAHHALDQAETLLLQLLRGAGLKGLSAMPLCRPFAEGSHLRPLLDVVPGELHRLAAALAIEAADDPMNHDPRFDRAYLRRELWPRIEGRWPAAAVSLARAARHLGEAQTSLDAGTRRSLERLRDGEALSVPGLRALAGRERLHVVRHWLRQAAVEPPSTLRLEEALRQIFTAKADHGPAVQWGEHVLRRYRDRLFLTDRVLPAMGEPLEWPVAAGSRLPLGAGLGALRWEERAGGLDPERLPALVSVRRRRGGETIKSAARARTQSVQHLCQAQGVLPWLRDALPMIYAGNTLIAVGDLWQDARSSVALDSLGLSCVWEDAPSLT